VSATIIYRSIGLFFALISLAEIVFIVLANSEILEISEDPYVYYVSIFGGILGLIISYGLWKMSVWGYVLTIILVPVVCVYSMYDVGSTNKHINDLFNGVLLGIYGTLLFILINRSNEIFNKDRWVCLYKRRLLLIPKVIIAGSLYLFIGYFFDNLVALLTILLLVIINYKSAKNPQKI